VGKSRFLEAHVLRLDAPNCLNRDDTGSPKTFTYGGTQRVQQSSQSVKRPARMAAQRRIKEDAENADSKLSVVLARRSVRQAHRLSEQLTEEFPDPEERLALSEYVLTKAKLSKKNKGNGVEEGVSLANLFLGDDELATIVAAVIAEKAAVVAAYEVFKAEEAEEVEESGEAEEAEESGETEKKDTSAKGGKKKDKTALPKAVLAAVKKGTRALGPNMFGRTLASFMEMNIVAACNVAHSMSVNEVRRADKGFYVSVDEHPKAGSAGAAFMGEDWTVSGAMYHYFVIDMEQLRSNYDGDAALAKTVALLMLEELALARPVGQKATKASYTPPSYIRVRFSGKQPTQATNAFDPPVEPPDLMRKAVDRLEKHLALIDKVYPDDGRNFDTRVTLLDSVEGVTEFAGVTSESLPALLEALSGVM